MVAIAADSSLCVIGHCAAAVLIADILATVPALGAQRAGQLELKSEQLVEALSASPGTKAAVDGLANANQKLTRRSIWHLALGQLSKYTALTPFALSANSVCNSSPN